MTFDNRCSSTAPMQAASEGPAPERLSGYLFWGLTRLFGFSVGPMRSPVQALILFGFPRAVRKPERLLATKVDKHLPWTTGEFSRVLVVDERFNDACFQRFRERRNSRHADCPVMENAYAGVASMASWGSSGTTRVTHADLLTKLPQALVLQLSKVPQRRADRASGQAARYLRVPNTFLSKALPVPMGSWRIFFSSSPIVK